MLDYLSTQLFYLLESTDLVPDLRLHLIIFSLTTWLNWVWLLISYSFKLFRLWCSSIQLPHGRWWKNLPITLRKIRLVRPRPHVKYTRALYTYITGVLITPTRMVINDCSQSWYQIIRLLHGGYYNLNMCSMFSASVRHMVCIMNCNCNIILKVYSQSMKVDYGQSITPSNFLVWCYIPMCIII